MSDVPRLGTWASYDPVADAYDGALPRRYVELAQDLVDLVRLPAGGRALDVGTGTGICALLATRAVGPAGFVAGVDVSPEMLRVARTKGLTCLVVAGAPGLPFRDGAFDGVLASLVVSHLPDHAAALRDMARVLVTGGRLGVTAWGTFTTEHGRLWWDTAVSFIDPETARDAIRRSVPWESHFADPANLETALRGAGLESIEVRRRDYPGSRPAGDFLRMMEISSLGRFLQTTLGPDRWQEFRRVVSAAFRRRMSSLLATTAHAHLAVGIRP